MSTTESKLGRALTDVKMDLESGSGRVPQATASGKSSGKEKLSLAEKLRNKYESHQNSNTTTEYNMIVRLMQKAAVRAPSLIIENSLRPKTIEKLKKDGLSVTIQLIHYPNCDTVLFAGGFENVCRCDVTTTIAWA